MRMESNANQTPEPFDCVFGYCKDPANSPECVCNEGYVGDSCNQCDEGYVLDGVRCVLAGGCEADSCGNHGTCREDGPGFVCDCHQGWAGNKCDRCAEGYVGDNCDQCDEGYVLDGTKCVLAATARPLLRQPWNMPRGRSGFVCMTAIKDGQETAATGALKATSATIVNLL